MCAIESLFTEAASRSLRLPSCLQRAQRSYPGTSGKHQHRKGAVTSIIKATWLSEASHRTELSLSFTDQACSITFGEPADSGSADDVVSLRARRSPCW